MSSKIPIEERRCGQCVHFGHYSENMCSYFFMPTTAEDKIAMTCEEGEEFRTDSYERGMG